MAKQGRRGNGSGHLRQLPSKRWQARWRGPDGELHNAPSTFDTKLDAETWLEQQARDVNFGRWEAPVTKEATPRFRAYAEGWFSARDLRPRTRSQYRRLLDTELLPVFGEVAIDRLTPVTVRNWWTSLDPSRPTWNEHAYALLRSIFTSAYREALIETNPCRLERTKPKRKVVTKVATAEELATILTTINPRYRAMVVLATWCAMRFGELAELRRGDIDLDAGVVRISRGVVRVDGEVVVGDPKTQAGRRTVTIPPHVLDEVKAHLSTFVDAEPGALLFPAQHGGHLAPSSLYKVWYPARTAAGRPDLRFHDLRHTGATLAAQAGATLAELMARVGHSSPGAAMRYQHAAQDRDAQIAAALSKLATGKAKLRAVK